MKHEFQDCIGARLRGISRTVDSIYRKHLQEHNVTESQLSILMALSKTGETEQHVIGSVLQLERSSLSRNLVRLMDQNYVLKFGAVNRPTIVLSQEGIAFLDKVIPSWNNAMDEIHQLIGEDAITGLQNFEKGFS